MLRWHLREGWQVIPTSVSPTASLKNIAVLHSTLTPEELHAVDGLDTGVRGGPEPDAITLADFGRAIPEA